MPYRVPVAGCGRIHGIISESRQRRGVVAARPTTAPRIASSPRCRALRRSIRVPHSPSRPCHVLHARKTFIISSPKWLMTLKAMRPDWGLGKGQEMSHRGSRSCRVAELPSVRKTLCSESGIGHSSTTDRRLQRTISASRGTRAGRSASFVGFRHCMQIHNLLTVRPLLSTEMSNKRFYIIFVLQRNVIFILPKLLHDFIRHLRILP